MSLGELIHEHVRAALEHAVREELAAVLGTLRYERRAVRHGYRNGHKARTLTGPTGPTRPHGAARHAFQPDGAEGVGLDRAPALPAAAAGQHAPASEGALQPLLKAAPLSRSAVSRIVGTLKGARETWVARSLAELDVVYVHLDAIALKIRCAGKVGSTAGARGRRRAGRRHQATARPGGVRAGVLYI